MANNFNDDEYVDSYSSNEEEEDRIGFYRRVCHGEDNYDEEQLAAWANERFKHKHPGRVAAVSIPSMRSLQSDCEPPANENEVQNHEPKLHLPKGGWQVQSVLSQESNDDLPTLMSQKLNFDLKPKKKFSGPRENAWKKMPNFFSDVAESSLPSSESFVVQKRHDTHRFPKKEEPVKEDEYKPVLSRSRERTERKPRLLPNPKKEEKPVFLKNTKMCKNGEMCNRRNNCTFAHTMEEFNPISCRFQDRCNQKLTCSFKHDSESKEDYLMRLSNGN